MKYLPMNRRRLLQQAVAFGALAPLVSGEAAAQPRRAPPTQIRWLDGAAPAHHEGQTWGIPWPRGAVRAGQNFALSGAPVQTWPLAYWPDGSIKWTAHAIGAGQAAPETFALTPGRPAAPSAPVSVRETADAIEVRTGALRWRIAKSGASVIASAHRGAREILRDARLTVIRQDQPEAVEGDPLIQETFVSDITTATIEQRGPVRALIKLEGTHRFGARTLLPFVLRLYFYAGADSVRVMHSFIFDADENADFIRGIGLSVSAPLTDALHDRHIRFSGDLHAEGAGLWGEAVRPLTGLRRDPGDPYREAQVAGRAVPPVEGMAATVRNRLELIPAWTDITLSQPNADGFAMRKRTGEGHGWIECGAGRRASGLVYVGGPSGGVALAMHDFWQRCPTQLDVRNAATDAATITAWLWSPDAPAMDLRFYHDGMGMDTHPEEIEGLEITYEDYQEGWGRPYGIARTTELTLWALPETPARERLAEMAEANVKQPRLVCTPERLHGAGVFGDWSVIDRSTPTRVRIEDRMDYLLAFYMGQVEQQRWYGFWHYGDVMHSYDADRHVWRYDGGGSAWANSELSPDLWLWYSYLRSGRADVFRLAEAMTRHTGEVDVLHIGPYRGFGTRHGVQHWSDSSKQPRVSNAAYRRIYYYLTADERVGDLMHALIGSDETLTRVDISRKLDQTNRPALPPGTVECGFGTTWCSFLAAWLTEWERTQDTRWRDRILNGMTSLAALERRWFAGGAPYELATGRFLGPGSRVSVSHLNAVFGAVEVNSELLSLLDAPAYRDAWLEYCRYYNAPAAEITAHLGVPVGGRNLRQGHSRLTAYAAREQNDPALAARAWEEFFSGEAGLGMRQTPQTTRVAGANVLNPVDEDRRVSTNSASQWGLAAIQNLALIGDALEAASPR